MQKLFLISVCTVALFLSQPQKTLKGTWEYRGGKFNNKTAAAPVGYSQQRKYNESGFEAFLLEKGEKPVKYEAGNYQLKGDTCLETQTYSMQPSKLLGVPVHYLYSMQHDTLVLKATLPSGAVEEDYWKRVR